MGTGQFIIVALLILLISLVVASVIVLLGYTITEKIRGNDNE